MAREFKAQRQAREAQSLEDARNYQNSCARNYQNSYPERLMKALGRATKLGWDISVVDEAFCVSARSKDARLVRLPYSIPFSAWHNDIEDLVADLTIAEKKAEKERRMENLRSTALAKLTMDERKSLGL